MHFCFFRRVCFLTNHCRPRIGVHLPRKINSLNVEIPVFTIGALSDVWTKEDIHCMIDETQILLTVSIARSSPGDIYRTSKCLPFMLQPDLGS